MILIVASKKDEAGMNIAQKIIEQHGFEATSERFQDSTVHYKKIGDAEAKLVFIKEDSINAQFISDCFPAELIIFVSRHSSISGIPTLSVHTPGNLVDEADFGGIPKKVSISPASMMKNVLQELTKMKEEMRLNFKVSYECTHHGPSLDAPCMFAELGSSPEQWRDLKAAEAVANSVVNAVTKRLAYPAALGIGGPHYNEKFTEIALKTSIAFGHIIPKYAVPSVDASTIEQCVERTKEKVEFAVFDWKGVRGADKNWLISVVSDLGLTIKRA